MVHSELFLLPHFSQTFLLVSCYIFTHFGQATTASEFVLFVYGFSTECFSLLYTGANSRNI
jgi:hypothetical protein